MPVVAVLADEAECILRVLAAALVSVLCSM